MEHNKKTTRTKSELFISVFKEISKDWLRLKNKKYDNYFLMKSLKENKIFKLDKNGLSLAFYKKEKLPYYKKIISDLEKFSKKNNTDVRICMHLSKRSKMQNMINIIHKKNFTTRPHKHLRKEEIYHLIKGKMKIEYFIKKKKFTAILEKNFNIFRMSKNTYHNIIPLSKMIIFHEIREGPFKKTDSIFKK